MLVGIHTNLDEGNRPDLERYEAILNANGIGHVRLNVNEPSFWEQVCKVDLFIYPLIGTVRHLQVASDIIPVLTSIPKIRCYPDLSTSWPYDDKIREYYLLSLAGFPVAKTWIFWDKQHALKWLQTATMPVIFKLKGGASSHNVVLVKNRSGAAQLIRKMFGPGVMSGQLIGWWSVKWRDMGLYHTARRAAGRTLKRLKMEEVDPYEVHHRGYVLFQQFLPGNTFDIRVTVIGNRAWFFRRYVRAHDFRASGSGNIDYDQKNVDPECIRTAFAISRKFNYQSMAYDFLYDAQHCPVLAEISYTFVDTAVWRCPGFWDDALAWHEGHVWPQTAVLSDALGLPDLRQPELEP